MIAVLRYLAELALFLAFWAMLYVVVMAVGALLVGEPL